MTAQRRTADETFLFVVYDLVYASHMVFASKSFLVNVRLSKREISQVDSLVSRGVFKSRSDALRETSGLGLAEMQKRLAIEELNRLFGSMKNADSLSAAEAGRQARDALWKDYLKKAGGDEEKALEMLALDSNKATARFRK